MCRFSLNIVNTLRPIIIAEKTNPFGIATKKMIYVATLTT